tara:strand:- start:307 stop:570 length:264 start_codon:yes stop_codon:yes gene_type:complete
MRLNKRQLKRIIREEKNRVISEANSDGTVSDDEDDAREDLLAHVEMSIDELIGYIKEEAYAIGGPYRGPAIKSMALRLLADKIHGAR